MRACGIWLSGRRLIAVLVDADGRPAPTLCAPMSDDDPVAPGDTDFPGARLILLVRQRHFRAGELAKDEYRSAHGNRGDPSGRGYLPSRERLRANRAANAARGARMVAMTQKRVEN